MNKYFLKIFIDIAVKASGSIKKSEKHNFVFKIILLYLKNYFLLLILLNSYLMIYIY